jgi:hypothetical protein
MAQLRARVGPDRPTFGPSTRELARDAGPGGAVLGTRLGERRGSGVMPQVGWEGGAEDPHPDILRAGNNFP